MEAVTGGTALRDVEVTGGRAVYKVTANAYQEAAGTWTWDTPGYTLSGEGEREFTMTFVPEDEDGFRRITGINVKLTVTKREVEIPLIAGLTYDGSLQKPVVNETADYEVTENNGRHQCRNLHCDTAAQISEIYGLERVRISYGRKSGYGEQREAGSGSCQLSDQEG